MKGLATSKGILAIISGPSGVGKSTIIQRLLQTESYELSVSATTRDPRKNEVDGVHYHFLTEAEFDKKIEEGAFLEFATVHGTHRYGTLVSSVERMLEDGKTALLDIDVQGFLNLETTLKSVSIFVAPPDLETLERRLRGRDTETEEKILKRLETATWELSHKDKYDHVVINDDLETAIKTMDEILQTGMA